MGTIDPLVKRSIQELLVYSKHSGYIESLAWDLAHKADLWLEYMDLI